MAIIYSYPQATPDLGDMVLGAKFENGVISTNSFYISDIINLVTTAGPQGPVGPTGAQGVVGPAGVAGVAGPVGPAGLNWQGSWSPAGVYVLDDAVGYGGASWFCTSPTGPSGTTPDSDPASWALLASEGAIGPAGATGTQGPTGAQGPIGATGTQGIVGPIGLTGPQGPAGVPPVKTIGSVSAGTNPFTILPYSINTVYTSSAGRGVFLPDTASLTIGTEILVYAGNNFSEFTIRGAVGGPASPISLGGIDSSTSAFDILPNQNYKFTYTGLGYWKGEAVGPSLQQVFNVGNTIANNGFTTTLTNTSIKVAASGNSGMTLNSSQIISEKNGGLDLAILQFPTTFSGIKLWNLPSISGTIALTSDIATQTLQQVTTTGNTTTNSITINGNNTLDINYQNRLASVAAQSISVTNNNTGAFSVMSSDGFIALGNPTNFQTQIAANNLANNAVQFELPNKTIGTYTLATIDDIPNLGPLTQGTISTPTASIPYDVMPYRINISVAPSFSHISLPNTNLTIGQEVYIQTINAMVIHGNPSNSAATTIFNSSGGSSSMFTATAGAFYKFTYLGVLDTYAPNARWVYQVLNQ